MAPRLGVDLTPLRVSSRYRRLYSAGFVSALATQAVYVATTYQLKLLTNSTLAVGTLGLIEVVPLLVAGLYGGVLADRLDRQRMAVWTEFVQVIAALALAWNASNARPHAWLLYVVDAVVIVAGSLQNPSIAAMNQRYVPHTMQRAAAALSNLRMTTASIIGPAAGGFLAVVIGPRAVFFFGGLVLAVAGALLMSLGREPQRGEAVGTHMDALSVGLRYARSRPDILGTYLVDICAMALAYPVVMFPFVADHFHESYALSLLYCGLPVGALLATLTSRWIHRVHHYGRAIVWAAAAWGLGIAVFGVSGSLWLVMAGLVFAGGADSISGIFRLSMWNESIPPDVRGRMGGVELISYAVGPLAGQFRAGAMAAWTTLRFSLVFGGLATTGVELALPVALPALWRFDARSDPHVESVRRARLEESPDAPAVES